MWTSKTAWIAGIHMNRLRRNHYFLLRARSSGGTVHESSLVYTAEHLNDTSRVYAGCTSGDGFSEAVPWERNECQRPIDYDATIMLKDRNDVRYDIAIDRHLHQGIPDNSRQIVRREHSIDTIPYTPTASLRCLAAVGQTMLNEKQSILNSCTNRLGFLCALALTFGSYANTLSAIAFAAPAVRRAPLDFGASQGLEVRAVARRHFEEKEFREKEFKDKDDKDKA
ncbi:hypothetical protein BDZ89DRAFT_1049709 [Hymenopellis radicata]|nr:hypothetical protein BDZ89DRAFT_1049709 [Hymenopellis radicata]